jgi:hypothetical protein
MTWRIGVLAVLCLSVATSRAQQSSQLQTADFRVAYDDRGVTSLSTPKDPFNAQLLARDQRLGVFARYRASPDAPWTDLPPAAFTTAEDNTLSYGTDGPLKITQIYKLEGAILDWTIHLENTATTPIEIGDLAIVLPWRRPGGNAEPRVTFEQAFTKHQFIQGHASFLYFVRPSGAPPYLIVTTKAGTSLEYTGSVGPAPAGGRGGGAFAAFIHSRVTGNGEKRGTWRQPHSSLTLAPGKSTTHGFRMQWAGSYDQMRDVLFNEGLFDIRIVPGMTLPEDLTAKIALRIKVKIESIDPEFPEQTIVKKLNHPSPDLHLYEVQFKKLGENLLTIRHGDGVKTNLEFFCTEPLETLIKKRSAFIASKQQWRDPAKWYDGLFSVYDMKNKVLRSPEDTDGWRGRNEYILASDDPALCKAPYVAAKNVHFPVREEIEAVEYYLKNYVWGKLQRTDKERPYPYGVYGIPNWKVQRDADAKRNFEANANNRPDLANKMRVWRSYDYPHMVMLYFHMYEIARHYPQLVSYLDAAGYLDRAYHTARAYFTYPIELLPGYYETYKWGCYNELVILNLIEALEHEGRRDDAGWLRAEWEKKVKYFVYDDPYPFRSEYSFDRTAFESSYALAKYGTTHEMKPDEKLWRDHKLWNDRKQEKWYSHPSVKREDSRAFMERQYQAGLAVRGWLETAYYLLGADFTGSSDRGAMSYMAQMGGWAVLDYGVNFAEKPRDPLQLGYASYLSAWSLMNTGRPDTNYGFWFPDKENDGASGWTFMTAKYGRGWYGKEDPRGPWHYDGEIDLGYGGALRSAATILTKDPTFDWLTYGGVLSVQNDSLSIIPRDGLRKRFAAILPDPQQPNTIHRLKIEFDRDGFAAERPIALDPGLTRISFTVENRTADPHTTTLLLALPTDPPCTIRQDDNKLDPAATGNPDYPLRVTFTLPPGGANIQIRRQAP